MTKYTVSCSCGCKKELFIGFHRDPEKRNAVIRERTLAGEYGEEWKTLLTETPEAVLTTDEQVYACSCGGFRQDPSLHLETAEKKRHYPHLCSLCGSRMRPWNPAEQQLKCPECGQPMTTEAEQLPW